MRKIVSAVLVAAACLLVLASCSDDGGYEAGSGTVSGPDVSYPEKESGMQFDDVLSLEGDWTRVE